MDKSKVVTVKTFSSPFEATIVQGLLTAAGIESSLIHADIQNMVLPMGNELAHIELCVAAEDEAEARKIIKAKFDKKEFKQEAEESVPFEEV